jgi:hypothetical protein
MTPIRTPFAGYEVLGPGDPLSSDGYAFQKRDPQVADRLGQIGAVLHRHDAHAALVDPTLAAVLGTASSGGSIAAGLRLYLTYTLLDADGGETLPVAVQNIVMAPGFLTPAGAPTLAPTFSTGALQKGSYGYAMSVADGAGGETTIGPSAQVLLPGGHPNATIGISGLAAVLAASSGGSLTASWRLWRKRNGGPWYLIGTGTGDTFSDNGVAGDCSVAPLLQSTTKGTNTLTVEVPTGQPSGTTDFNVYVSQNGSFTAPCLIGGPYPASDLGTTKTFTALTFTGGAPPPISTSYPGADQIDPDTDILFWTWKRTQLTYAALIALTGNTTGDVRVALDTALMYTWDGTGWERLPWRYAVADFASLPTLDLRDGDVCQTLDTHVLWTYDLGLTAWRPPSLQRQTAATAVTALVAATETAEALNMVGFGMTIYAVTVDAACRVRIYPTAALALADVARGASADPDVAAQNGCYCELTFAGAGTVSLTPTVVAIMQEGTLAHDIAANVSSPAGGDVNFTLFGYRLD